jgi:hypothetical protein
MRTAIMRAVRLTALGLATTATAAVAQPSVTAASGQWNHQARVTIQGSSFGSKSAAAPVVWDDASGTNISAKWSGGWPNRSSNSTYNINYRTPIRGINPPHSRVGRYLAGAHAENGGYDAGYNVLIWKTRQNAVPYTYMSWYQRADDAWTFAGDNNHKTWDVSASSDPYNLSANWYMEYNPTPSSRTSGCAWHINDNGSSLSNPSNWWGSACTNPMSAWSKAEILIKWSSGSDGFIRIFDNGRQVLNYSGPTDSMPGAVRTEAIGGYSRNSGYANNWRYFTDLYVDYTLSHVVLGNASTYSACTIREAQVPTAWSGSSITLNVNLGQFSSGQTAYVYVMDANGNVNANGLAITVGGGSPPPPPPTAPAAPTNVRIVTP